MTKTKKILSLVMAVLMLVSCVSMGKVQAATTISYAPNPKVEYGYSSGVTTGTIRYISQINGSAYFNSNYWGNWAGQAGIECGTASISMALSYVGVNKTPKAILDAHSGTTYFTGWGPTTSNPSVANGMNNYINGNGKYSPPIVHFTTGYASGSHYVILIGKVSSSSYLVLDPASNNTWTLSTSDAKYKSINQVFQYYNASASIVPDIKEPTSIIYPTSGATYKIASGVGNNMYLDFACTNDNVQIYENCDGHSNPDFVKSQYFKLTHVGDGWYTIINPANGKAVDVCDANPASDTNVWQYEPNGTNAQLFRFYDAGNGYCYIKSKLGCYVDVAGANNTNNTNVWMVSFNGTNAQKWKLIKKDVPGTHTHSYTSTITTNPTCKTDGIRTYKCGCGASYTQNIGKHPATHVGGTEIRNARVSTCKDTGYTGDTYCKGCGVCLGFGTSIAKNYNNHTGGTTIKNAKTATCTSEGYTGDTYCKSCNTKLSSGKAIAKNLHNSNITIPAVANTCTKTGLTEGKKCSACGTVTVAQQTVAVKSHKDDNQDYECDYGCGYEFEKPEVENPTTNCSCNCHKGGIVGFFFKLINFFEKIFGINKVCACGVAHY